MLVLLRLGAAAARAGAAGDLGRAGRALRVLVRRPAAARGQAVVRAGSPPWPSPGAGARCATSPATRACRRALLPRFVCRKERAPAQIDDDQKDDVAARFDGLRLWYALRYSIRPSNAEALVALARRGAQDATLHWRHRLVADVVLGHALAARDQDDGDDETWNGTWPRARPTRRTRRRSGRALAVALRFSRTAPQRGGALQGAGGAT